MMLNKLSGISSTSRKVLVYVARKNALVDSKVDTVSIQRGQICPIFSYV